MAKVNIEDIRQTILKAGRKVDALLKDNEEEFYFDINTISFDMGMCSDDLEDEDTFLGIEVSFRWLDEMTYRKDKVSGGANSTVSLNPWEVVSPDFVAGYLLAAIQVAEKVFIGGERE